MTTRAGLRNQSGFSLIELLVALALLSVGLLAVASMQGVAINANAFANRLSTAAALAQAAMEDMLARNIEDPLVRPAAPTTTIYDLNPGNASNDLFIIGAGTYSATCTVNPNTPVFGVSEIIITVEETVEGRDGRRRVRLTSYKRVI